MYFSGLRVQMKAISLSMKYCPSCASRLEDRLVEGLERKVCRVPGCGYVHWDNPVPVVAAVVQFGDQIVLARNAKWPPGMFSMITGFLERNETPEEAVARELKEELGLDVEASGFIGHYSFGAMNQVILAFWVTAIGELRTSDEIAEVELVSKDDLVTRDFGRLALTRAVVQDWLQTTRNVKGST
jgi:NAD+ diphosphatase